MHLSARTITLQQTQRTKRDKLFLKGPIRFDWIARNIPDPSSRLILVCQAFMDMAGQDAIALSARVWASAKIEGKDARARVVKNIREFSEDYEIIYRSGRTSLFRRKNT